MDNIEELLRALAGDGEETGGGERDDESGSSAGNAGGDGESGGLFSGLDPEMLLKILSLLEALGQPDDNERFLLALKPLLREENRHKIDAAIRLLKLFSLLPLLRESGLLETLM